MGQYLIGLAIDGIMYHDWHFLIYAPGESLTSTVQFMLTVMGLVAFFAIPSAYLTHRFIKKSEDSK